MTTPPTEPTTFVVLDDYETFSTTGLVVRLFCDVPPEFEIDSDISRLLAAIQNGEISGEIIQIEQLLQCWELVQTLRDHGKDAVTHKDICKTLEGTWGV